MGGTKSKIEDANEEFKPQIHSQPQICTTCTVAPFKSLLLSSYPDCYWIYYYGSFKRMRGQLYDKAKRINALAFLNLFPEEEKAINTYIRGLLLPYFCSNITNLIWSYDVECSDIGHLRSFRESCLTFLKRNNI